MRFMNRMWPVCVLVLGLGHCGEGGGVLGEEGGEQADDETPPVNSALPAPLLLIEGDAEDAYDMALVKDWAKVQADAAKLDTA